LQPTAHFLPSLTRISERALPFGKPTSLVFGVSRPLLVPLAALDLTYKHFQLANDTVRSGNGSCNARLVRPELFQFCSEQLRLDRLLPTIGE
jgi:hypothetical protein